MFPLTDGALTIAAGPRTDLFADPAGAPPVTNAPTVLATADGDFQLSALVSVEFAATYDAGGLVVIEAADRWAKLCFERSPQGRPLVVSVVTRGSSDDANGWPVSGDSIRLRVSRSGSAYALHASADGAWWELVRYFGLAGGAASVGFLAQSPTGEGCRASFGSVRFAPEGVRDIRNGA